MYQSVPFEEAFAYTKELLYTYPNSELLKLRIASNTMYVMMFGGESMVLSIKHLQKNYVKNSSTVPAILSKKKLLPSL